MNFGYPFQPYNPGFNPYNDESLGTSGGSCGCGNNDNMSGRTGMYGPTGMYAPCGASFMNQGNPGFYNVVSNTCYEDVPYYVNYHTHNVTNVIRRHIEIPTCSESNETVYYDEWPNKKCCNR